MVLHDIDDAKEFDLSALDSFVVYIALKGSMQIVADGNSEKIDEGEVVLIPAETNDVTITGSGKVMEIYIKQ